MDTDSAYRTQALINAAMKNMLNMCHGMPKNLEHGSIKTATGNPIEKVIFNPPATIVFWKNGGKTVVQTRGDDEFNPEIGLAMAISKHYLCDICGLKRYDGVFKKYITKEKSKLPGVYSAADSKKEDHENAD